MALWSNTDNAAGGIKTPRAFTTIHTGNTASATTTLSNTKIGQFTTGQIVGIYGVDVTEQAITNDSTKASANSHPAHSGWVLRRQGTGGIISITANTNAFTTNGSVTFSGGGTGATPAVATVVVNGNGSFNSLLITNPGVYSATPTAAPPSGNAVFTVTVGGRMGRVQTETLVAMGSMINSGADDEDTVYIDS
jgi:hypothetical protein